MAAENWQEGDPASVLQPLLKGIVSGTLRLGSENVCRTPVVASPRCICTCVSFVIENFQKTSLTQIAPTFWNGFGEDMVN